MFICKPGFHVFDHVEELGFRVVDVGEGGLKVGTAEVRGHGGDGGGLDVAEAIVEFLELVDAEFEGPSASSVEGTSDGIDDCGDLVEGGRMELREGSSDGGVCKRHLC